MQGVLPEKMNHTRFFMAILNVRFPRSKLSILRNCNVYCRINILE